MLRQPHKDNRGFTIIEVLIVLAIAGLIMLIVFLAVPALRRNQQNTTMRNEASRLLSAVTEYESNANGQQVNSQGKLEDVEPNAGTLTQITTVTYQASSHNGNVADGTILVGIGRCDGTNFVAEAGRTYAAKFGLNGGADACIQS